MSIRCVCQNGHVLKVKDSLAGTSGLCPACKGTRDVPRPQQTVACRKTRFWTFWGSKAPPQGLPPRTPGVLLATSDSGIYGQPLPKKTCNRCNQEVSAGTHICPHCHTYIANLSDF